MNLIPGAKTSRPGKSGLRRKRSFPGSREPDYLRKTLISLFTTLALVATTMGMFFIGVGAGCLNSISPTSGTWGDTVTLTGSGFGARNDCQVFFGGGVTSHEIVSWSDTRIVCKVPPGAETGNVFVSGNGGNSSVKPFTVDLGTMMVDLSPNEDFSRTVVEDKSGYHNHGDIEGDVAFVPDRWKNSGKALFLPCNNSHVKLDNDLGLRHLDGLALIADTFINQASQADTMTILNKEGCFKLEAVNHPGVGWQLLFSVRDKYGRTNLAYSDPNTDPLPMEDCRITAWFNAADSKLEVYIYSQGLGQTKLVASNNNPTSSIIADVQNDVYIGMDPDGSGQFDGVVGKVKICDLERGKKPGDYTETFLEKLDLLVTELKRHNVAISDCDAVLQDIEDVYDNGFQGVLDDPTLLLIDNHIRDNGLIGQLDQALDIFYNRAGAASAQAMAAAAAGGEWWQSVHGFIEFVLEHGLSYIAEHILHGKPGAAYWIAFDTSLAALDALLDGYAVATDTAAPGISCSRGTSMDLEVDRGAWIGFDITEPSQTARLKSGVAIIEHEFRDQNNLIIPDPASWGISVTASGTPFYLPGDGYLGPIDLDASISVLLVPGNGWGKSSSRQSLKLRITTWDVAGNENHFTLTINVKNTAPRIEYGSVSVDNNSIRDFADLGNLDVTFTCSDPDLNIDHAYITLSSWSGNPIVGGTINYVNPYITFDPNATEQTVSGTLVPSSLRNSGYFNLNQPGTVKVTVKVRDDDDAYSNSETTFFKVEPPEAPQINDLGLSKPIVSNTTDRYNQRLSFDCRDEDGDLYTGQVWMRLTGDPVTDTSWFSLSAAEFGIGSTTSWQYNKGCYIFRKSGIQNRIDLSKRGTVTAWVYLKDQYGNQSPTLYAEFLVSPSVYYYVYADFTWGQGTPEAFVEIYQCGASPPFYAYGQIYGRGGSVKFEGRIPCGEYLVHFHNFGEYTSGGNYTVAIGNAYNDDVRLFEGTWGFYSQDTVSGEWYFVLDSVNGVVRD
ncbi:MAG: hypothetical protein C4536_12865 [Actinobacteria bacterium]|jgi:hypothetical protein|nr:MAG: hypothetical protein C4536_12865 [Actinomycetota bacterium]